MPDFSFQKNERLSSRKTISSLFQAGKSIHSFPVRILYNQEGEGPNRASVAITVPKRLFNRAVDRNLLKRRIREIYRLYKPLFYSRLSAMDIRVNLVIHYNHQAILDYKQIESGLKKGLEDLLQSLENKM